MLTKRPLVNAWFRHSGVSGWWCKRRRFLKIPTRLVYSPCRFQESPVHALTIAISLVNPSPPRPLFCQWEVDLAVTPDVEKGFDSTVQTSLCPLSISSPLLCHITIFRVWAGQWRRRTVAVVVAVDKGGGAGPGCCARGRPTRGVVGWRREGWSLDGFAGVVGKSDAWLFVFELGCGRQVDLLWSFFLSSLPSLLNWGRDSDRFASDGVDCVSRAWVRAVSCVCKWFGVSGVKKKEDRNDVCVMEQI
jgi:hypothetical protein